MEKTKKKASGRKKLPEGEKKIQIILYVRERVAKLNGGKSQSKEKAEAFLEKESEKFKNKKTHK